MELFSELYGCYYQTARKILERAKDGISEQEMKQIADETAFAESGMHILSKLISGEWNLLDKNSQLYYAKTKHPTPLYLTKLQLMFIKSMLRDKRIRLFLTDSQILKTQEQLKNIEPLFLSEDFRYFDQFQDGDPYEDEQYITNFRVIHQALREKRCLEIIYKNNIQMETFLPGHLEYSGKNDKFRLYAIKLSKGKPKQKAILNLSSIHEAKILYDISIQADPEELLEKYTRRERVTFLIFNERNALERCNLQFSSLEKHIRYLKEEHCFECTMYYDKADEKELVIRLLSFGPLIKVTGPEPFLGIIRKRIARQHHLLS